MSAKKKDEPTRDLSRAAPETRDLTFKEVLQTVINEAQFQILQGKTPKHVIRTKPKGGKDMPYVPHGYVRDQLNKAFGFDWDFDILPSFGGEPFHLVERNEKGKATQYVTVLGQLVIRIRNPKDVAQVLTTIRKTGFGSQVWRADMEFGDALKGAASDALKVCGLGLGIALDLYYDEATELQRYEDAQQWKAAQIDTPKTLVDLLSRAMADYQLDAQALQAKLSIQSLSEIGSTPDAIQAAWQKVGGLNGNH